MPNQEPVFAWPYGNGPVRVGTQGLFHLCLKTFVAPFLPARLTGPGSPRMEYFGNRAPCLSRSRFHLSSFGPCKKNTAKGTPAKKLFKVSLLSWSKIRSLIFLGKPLEFLPVYSRLQAWSALKFSNMDHIFFHGKVTIQFLHQLRSHSNKARLKSGKAKSTSQSSGFTDIFLSILGQN